MLLLGFSHPIFSSLIILSNFVLIAGSIWLWRLDENSIIDLGFHKNEDWMKLIIIGLIEAFIMVSLLFAFITQFSWMILSSKQFSLEIFNMFLLGGIRGLLLISVEEITFRGYYLQKYSQDYSNKVGIVISSILWALLYFPNMLIKSELPLFHLSIGIISLTMMGIGLSIGFLKANFR
jgi:membrane protease YdiL (CAAX protease family)